MPLDHRRARDETLELERYNPDVLAHLARLEQLHFSFAPDEQSHDNSTLAADIMAQQQQQQQDGRARRRTTSGRLNPSENPLPASASEGASAQSQSGAPHPHSRTSHAPPAHSTVPTPGPSLYHPSNLAPHPSFDSSHFPFTLPLPVPSSSQQHFPPASWPAQAHFPQLPPISTWDPSPSSAGPPTTTTSMDSAGVPHPEMGAEAFWIDMLAASGGGGGGGGIQHAGPSTVHQLTIHTGQTTGPLDPAPASPVDDKRRRNTAASARFRIKKKQRLLNLERSVADLQGRAEELEKETGELRRENGWLREMVLLKGGIGSGSAGAGRPPTVAGPAAAEQEERGKGKGRAKASRRPPPAPPSEEYDSGEDYDSSDSGEEPEPEPPAKSTRGKKGPARKK